jgi:hypothetical protein
LEDNDDVVETGEWEDIVVDVDGEDTGNGRPLMTMMRIRASTDWLEHRDPYGLEKFEPAKNVHVYEVPGYEHTDDVSKLY